MSMGRDEYAQKIMLKEVVKYKDERGRVVTLALIPLPLTIVLLLVNKYASLVWWHELINYGLIMWNTYNMIKMFRWIYRDWDKLKRVEHREYQV